MSPALPREERDAIRVRAQGGTEGTWTASVTGHVWSNPGEPVLVAQVGWAEDAEFIAHARTDVPALLDALDVAEEENEREHREAVTWRDLARAEQDQRQAIQAERDAARAEVERLRAVSAAQPYETERELAAALDDARAALAALREQYRDLATYRTTHTNLGLCPEGPDDPARDPDCPVCAALAAAPSETEEGWA